MHAYEIHSTSIPCLVKRLHTVSIIFSTTIFPVSQYFEIKNSGSQEVSNSTKASGMDKGTYMYHPCKAGSNVSTMNSVS